MKSKKSTKKSNNSNTLHNKSNNVYNYCCLFIIFIIIIYNIYKSNKSNNNSNTFNVHKKDNNNKNNKNNNIQGNRYIESFAAANEVRLIQSITINDYDELKFTFYFTFDNFLKTNRTKLKGVNINLYIYIDVKVGVPYTVFITGELDKNTSGTALHYKLNNINGEKKDLSSGDSIIDFFNVPVDDIITHYLKNKEFERTMDKNKIKLKIKGDVTIDSIKTVFQEHTSDTYDFKTIFLEKYEQERDMYIKKLENGKEEYVALKAKTKAEYYNKLLKYGIKYDDKLDDYKNLLSKNIDTYNKFDNYFIKEIYRLDNKKLHGANHLIELDGELSVMITEYRKWYSAFKLYIENYYNIDLKQKYDIIMNKEENIEELNIYTEKPNIVMGSESAYFNRNVINVGKFDLITDIEEDINDYTDVPNDYTCN
jgi:hypothetical protein